MWRILPLKLSLGQDTSPQSSNLCFLIFTVFFAASWTSRSARASAVSLGGNLQPNEKSKGYSRDILQSDPLTGDFPKRDASRSWPPISTSPKWYRSRQYTYDTMAFWCRRSSLSIESPKTKESRISTQKVAITITQSHLEDTCILHRVELLVGNWYGCRMHHFEEVVTHQSPTCFNFKMYNL